jgi:hypothetical protein
MDKKFKHGCYKVLSFYRFLVNHNIIFKNMTLYTPRRNGICERLVGIVRRELLDHVIPFNQRHLEGLLKEYVYYYNNIRTHQSLNGESPIKKKPPPLTLVEDTMLLSKPILGGLYHSYEKQGFLKSA